MYTTEIRWKITHQLTTTKYPTKYTIRYHKHTYRNYDKPYDFVFYWVKICNYTKYRTKYPKNDYGSDDGILKDSSLL